MILILDVGNTQILAGVFIEGELRFQFRKSSRAMMSSDEFGLFLRSILRENELDPRDVQRIGLATVVPELLYTITSACKKYFDLKPFVLQPGVKSGLKLGYKNPLEIGADRIANSIGAVDRFPNRHLIIVDFGTATTFCVVSKQKDYLGGVITPGLRISMEALEKNTSKLPSVEIVRMKTLVGRSTVESIQSGLYFSNVFAVRGIIQEITRECFPDEKPLVIGTGGFSRLFENDGLFDHWEPDLVLHGLYRAYQMNIKEVQNETHLSEGQDSQSQSHWR